MKYILKVFSFSNLLVFCSLFIIISIIQSCDDGGVELYTLDVRNIDYNNIVLSEMADDVTYTSLANDSPIEIYYDTKVFKDHIIINGRINGISIYDRKGHFIRQVGSKGRGPGEYYFCTNIAVDYEGKRVYVRDSHDIKVYNLDGNFIRSFDIIQHAGQHIGDSRGYENFFSDIVYFKPHLFVATYISGGRAYNDWVVIDTFGNLVSEKLNYIPGFGSYRGWGGVTYEYKDKIYYHNHYNDTLFSVSRDLSYGPSMILDFGVTIPETKEWEQEDNRKRFLSDINEMFETDRYWIMLCSREQQDYEEMYVIVDKETKKSYLMYDREPSESNYGPIYTGGIFNDLDGGVPFQPEGRYEENGREYMLELVSPFTLKNHIASDDFKNAVPKYPEKKEKLIELANSLDEMDNLILVSVRLK